MRIVDDRGVCVPLPRPPERVVSLVPSTTETVFALGLGDRLVGVTRFCVHPAGARSLPKVGGTKDADADRIRALRPDLILANCEENTREILDEMASIAPVLAAFPRTVADAIADLDRLGRALGAEDRSRAWIARIEAGLAELTAVRTPFRHACMIWQDPWMAASSDTFLASVLERAGGTPVFDGSAGRYPVVDPRELGRLDPDRVLLPSEPFPFRAVHADRLAAESGLPRERFVFVDGELLTWHGARMALAFPWLARCAREGWPTTPVDHHPELS